MDYRELGDLESHEVTLGGSNFVAATAYVVCEGN